MRYFSAFSGVGGFDLGMPANWECIGMSEINKQANMVLKYHFKDVKNYGDIEKINYEELPDFELLIGGSPCQDISIAGKRAGLAGLRSRLFFSYVAILKVKKPQYFIFENVKGLLSSNSGWDFAEVANQFSEAGYDIWWQVLDAADFGIPQHRERIFIFGALGGSGIKQVFFEPEDKGEDTGLRGPEANTIRSLYRDKSNNRSYIIESQFNTQIEKLHNCRTQTDRIYGTNGIAPTIRRKTVNIGIPVLTPGRLEKRQNGRRIKENGEPSFTLTRQDRHGVAIPSADAGNSPCDSMDIRYLTPLECERLMGWPDDFTKYGIDGNGEKVELSDNARYNLIGNGVVPQVVRVIIEEKIKDL